MGDPNCEAVHTYIAPDGHTVELVNTDHSPSGLHIYSQLPDLNQMLAINYPIYQPQLPDFCNLFNLKLFKQYISTDEYKHGVLGFASPLIKYTMTGD